MYCVRCGVKLQEGAKSCPLCQTPVIWKDLNEENLSATFSKKYPKETTRTEYLKAGVTTAVMAVLCLLSLIICLTTYGEVFWSGFVMLGMAVLWICFVLPFFFKKRKPFVFIPIDFLAIGGYLLYICLYTGGKWFLSFAFPVTGIAFLFTEAAVLIVTFLRKGRLLALGLYLIAFGAAMMLVEFFQYITFDVKMFQWSLYCVVVFGAIGAYFVIASKAPGLKEKLEKKFFI